MTSSKDDNLDEEYEDFMVEETEKRVVSPVVYKKWPLPMEKCYWHPGSISDAVHLETVPSRIKKNAETETMTDHKGRLRYRWRKVAYNKILLQGSKCFVLRYK